MSQTIIVDRVQVKRADSATWTNLNPILIDGEPGFERDTNQLKIGNGSTAWNDLNYLTGTGGATIIIEDEGTPVTQRNKIDFVGNGIAVTDDGVDTTTVTVTITSTLITSLLDVGLGNNRWKVVEVPQGGATGQVLKKLSSNDYDYAWGADLVGSSGSGATQLIELQDVNSSNPVNKYVLIADGTDFESRQLVADDISDFTNAVNTNSAVAANTAKITNATHTGEVTGSTILTITNSAVTGVKIQDGTITSTKIANDAITTAAILDGTITPIKINPAIVDGYIIKTVAGTPTWATPIDDASITGDLIANNSINDNNISETANIQGTKLLDDSIPVSKIINSVTDGQVLKTVAGVTVWANEATGTGKISSDVTGLTGAEQITNMVKGTKVEIESWVDDPNRLDICTDCPDDITTFVTKTTDATAILADAEVNKKILLDYNDESFTINPGIFSIGHHISLQSIGAGIAYILPGTGVTFGAGAIWESLQLDGIGKSVTMYRLAGTAPEIWFPEGYILGGTPPFTPAPLASNSNPELITTVAAFTPLSIATNVIIGSLDNQMINILGGASHSVENALPNVYGVQFCLRVNSTTSNNDRYSYYLKGLTASSVYSIAVLTRKISGDGSTRLRNNTADGTGTIDAITTSTNWTLFSGTFTPTGTQQRLDIYGNYNGATPAGTSEYLITVKLQ